jgi:UDP-2,3-diacylglucosamine hydrolase
MGDTYFISDLHLCAERPETSAAFFDFMRNTVREAGTLYVLGDLFEYWIGDDQLDHDPLARDVAAAFRESAQAGTRNFFMHGNRDFLIGARFAESAAMELKADPSVIECNGEPVLLMHGDTLCTGDTAYQDFRRHVRGTEWQREFLARPYAERDAIAKSIRSRSSVEKSMKAEAIMDVEAAAVTHAFKTHGCRTIIHGHTHRPATHGHGDFRRHVLPDWGGHACGMRLGEGAPIGELARFGLTPATD